MSNLWTCIATCQVCGKELNRAEHVPEDAKTRVEVAAPLVAICDVRGHSTLNDCNIGVEPVATNKWVELGWIGDMTNTVIWTTNLSSVFSVPANYIRATPLSQ